MVKKLEKILACLLVIILLFNFTYNGVSFATDDEAIDDGKAEEIALNAMKSLAITDDGHFNPLKAYFSGLVGIGSLIIRIPILVICLFVQSIGTGIATIAGKTDPKVNVTLLTPDDIIFNKITLTDINFFNIDGLKDGNVIRTIREQIALWYYIMRILAVAILLVILLIVGIKMSITTIASEKAIYKKSLIDWATSLALIFILHYLMRGIIYLNEVLVNIIAGIAKQTNMGEMVKALGILTINGLEDVSLGIGSTILYVMITVETIIFLIAYIKRMLTLAFLIIISPLITITYSLDKMGDQKAQALNTWLKEFIYNVLIQPFHCILYAVFVTSAVNIVSSSGSLAAMLLAILCLKFVWDGEKIVKKIFGFEQASSLGALAASSAMVGAALGKATSIGAKGTSAVKFAKNTKTGQLLKEKMGAKKETRLKDKAARQVGGRGMTYDLLSDKQKKAADIRINNMKKTPIRRMAENKEYNRLKEKAKKSSANISETALLKQAEKNVTAKKANKEAKRSKTIRGKAGKAFKDLAKSDLGQAIGSDLKRYTRKLTRPENIAKLSAGIMAGAAMFALPESNLFSAASSGYVAGKGVEGKVREMRTRKKENFEENVEKAWERQCAITGNKNPTGEDFKNWYENTYNKGKQTDEYSSKNVGKVKSSAEKDLKDSKVSEEDISRILRNLETAILKKEKYDPTELFKGIIGTDGIAIDPSTIASLVQKYASTYNESVTYQNAAAYNEQMEQFGITHADIVEELAGGKLSGEHDESKDEILSKGEIEELRDKYTELADAHKDFDSRDIIEIIENGLNNELYNMQTSLERSLQANGMSESDSTKFISDITTQVQSLINNGERNIENAVRNALAEVDTDGKVSTIPAVFNQIVRTETIVKQKEYIQSNTREVIKLIKNKSSET